MSRIRPAPVLVLVVVWLALWGRFTTATVVSGVAVAVIVSAVSVRSTFAPLTVRPVRLTILVGWFAWMLVMATVEVAWEVLTPTDRTRPGFIDVPLTLTHTGLVTLVANMVSLTPGTLSIEADVDDPKLKVHVMHLVDAERSRSQVLRLEQLVLAAFGEPRGSRAGDRTSGVDR